MTGADGSPVVGDKRKRSISDFTWGEISALYEMDNRQLVFTPTLIPLPEKDFMELVVGAQMIFRTSKQNRCEPHTIQ